VILSCLIGRVAHVSRFSRRGCRLLQKDARFIPQCGITVIPVRFHFDERKSARLRANPKRGIGFEEAQEIFSHPYYLDQRSDWPEQYRAIGWVGEQLYAVIFELREDEEGEYYHLVTLWKATRQEQELYEEHS
jgi:uncharacterized DUF497 family protein